MQESSPSLGDSIPRISIAMAVYNGGKYLETQLSSLSTQSLLPDELVVCDDCSTDNSLEILHSFAEKVPFPVKVITNHINQGYVFTFNKALDHTSGELIFLCDQDDFWFENKIREVYDFARENPDFLLYLNNAELANGELSPQGLTLFGQMINAGLKVENLVLGCCMAIRRELLDLCCPIPANFSAHDVWINEMALMLDSKIVLDQVLQYYRRHQKNESTHILYSFHKVTKWDYKFNYIRNLIWKKSISNLGTRLVDKKHLVERFEKLKEILPTDKKTILEIKLNQYTTEVEILKARKDLLSNSFFQRVRMAIHLLQKRQYAEVYGIGSFFKDVLNVH